MLDEATARGGERGREGAERAADAALAGRTAVVVLGKGRIVEQGAHDELVRTGGRYAALWSAWSTPRTGA